MTSLGVRISPNISVLAFISIFSRATILPLIFPRTTTVLTLMLPLTTALSPRFRLPSELTSPSSFPSKVISPENLRAPFSSTSELRTFFELLLLGGVFIVLSVHDSFTVRSFFTLTSPRLSTFVLARLIAVNASAVESPRVKRVLMLFSEGSWGISLGL